jgi:hypothetical protein
MIRYALILGGIVSQVIEYPDDIIDGQPAEIFFGALHGCDCIKSAQADIGMIWDGLELRWPDA